MAETPKAAETLSDDLAMPWETGGAESQDDTAENLFDLLDLGHETTEESERAKPKKSKAAKAGEDEGDEAEDNEEESEAASDDEDDESEEEDDESDDGEESDEEDEGDEEETEAIVVDGEKVTPDRIRELKKGELRQADYTRKTQEAAAIRKEADTEKAQARQAREEYAAGVKQLHELLSELAGEEPNWEQIRKDSPEKFATLHAEWDLKQKHIDRVRQEREKVEREQAEEYAKDLRSKAREEFGKLREAVPEWKDEEKAKEGIKAVANYAKTTYGFTDQDISSIGDHRVFVLLKKAMERDQLEKGKTKIREKVKTAKVLKPGAVERSPAPKKKQQREFARRMDRLGKSGSVRDAASVFELMLD